jgi:hypothetical protein
MSTTGFEHGMGRDVLDPLAADVGLPAVADLIAVPCPMRIMVPWDSPSMAFNSTQFLSRKGPRAEWYSSCLDDGMASLLPFDRVDWIVAVLFAAILTMIVLLQASLPVRERIDLRDTGVCERPAFFVSFH